MHALGLALGGRHEDQRVAARETLGIVAGVLFREAAPRLGLDVVAPEEPAPEPATAAASVLAPPAALVVAGGGAVHDLDLATVDAVALEREGDVLGVVDILKGSDDRLGHDASPSLMARPHVSRARRGGDAAGWLRSTTTCSRRKG